MKINTRFTAWIVVSLLSGVALAQETEISRKDVPPAVLSAFNKAYSNVKVLEWEKEIHGGKLYYEAETVDGKVSRNVLFSPDGSIVQTEEKIALKDLPQLVTDAVKKQYPNATIRSAYKVSHLDETEYALSTSGTNLGRLVVNTEGTVVSTEGKKAIDRNPL